MSDEKHPPKEPQISIATTGRSKCHGCKEPIEKNTTRVGMPDRHNSLTVFRWLHPNCFASNMRIDVAPTGRAKCAADGTLIKKGEPRLLMRLLNCEGATKSQKIYKPQNALPFLAELREVEGVGELQAGDMDGVAELEEAQRSWVTDLLAGESVEGREVPLVEEDVKKLCARKRKNTSQGQGGECAEDVQEETEFEVVD
eukprot:CAMPEP_0183351088 /NCGR_PEP_ID=MMETSP0164_2-20130417/23356_1 /TAXON_ID=221442 /ORGANISM="Coccolithus pelagicus ssp braarudi, Strain PLY182g" /LENGTH=198 /DNA_ID=CAMNT_0025523189 /DNA_START=71 /DNA_END=667 /DNA_ORIENTATION=-